MFDFSLAFEPKIPDDSLSREDDHFVDEQLKVFCVLDGMGGAGHEDANYSSRVAKEGIMKLVKELAKEKKSDLYLTKLDYGLKLRMWPKDILKVQLIKFWTRQKRL